MNENLDATGKSQSAKEREAERALRPKGFDSFAGQQQVLDNLRIFVSAAKDRGEPLDHVLLHGPPGLGKTTLSYIIANELGVNIKMTSGPVLDKPGDLAGLLTGLGANDVLFIDEIQMSAEAIMSLRFFKEDLPDLHVIAAGSLLEFALEEIPTFGVGRIHSMFMFPMTFDEFLMANGEERLITARNAAQASNPLPSSLYEKIISLFRTYILVGGMPEAVSKWVDTHDYIACQEIQDDIVVSYEDDFSKYKKKADPVLLRQTLHSVATQITEKFVYSKVSGDYKASEVKKALERLSHSL